MTRKIGVLLLATILMITVCAVASASLYYVTGNGVRVRSGPGTDYTILSHLNRGAKINVESISGGWARMTLWSGSDTGYISTRYISRNKPSSGYSPAPSYNGNYQAFTPVSYYVIVNPKNTYVNMRWEASKASPVRRIYYYGAQLKVIAENGSWAQVIDESTGEVGFIMKSRLLRI